MEGVVLVKSSSVRNYPEYCGIISTLLGDRLTARLDSADLVKPRRIGQRMFYTYVLKSTVAEKSYVGFTHDLERRIREHNSGKHSYTKRYAPWLLIYKETYKTVGEARKREVYFKSRSGRRFLKNIWEIV